METIFINTENSGTSKPHNFKIYKPNLKVGLSPSKKKFCLFASMIALLK